MSKKQILTSIKGRNSVANLRKTMIYKTNVDLVNDNVYTKFGLNRSIFPNISLWDFSRAASSPVLGRIWPNFELDQDVINIFVTCKYEEDPIKNSVHSFIR